MSLTIVWSALIEDSDAPCVARETTQILSAIPIAPPDAAATVLKWWLEEEPSDAYGSNWTVEFGEDEVKATAAVVIHEPPEAAGVYSVELERLVVARGYPADQDQAAAVLSALAERRGLCVHPVVEAHSQAADGETACSACDFRYVDTVQVGE